jgi:hypothetical protein
MRLRCTSSIPRVGTARAAHHDDEHERLNEEDLADAGVMEIGGSHGPDPSPIAVPGATSSLFSASEASFPAKSSVSFFSRLSPAAPPRRRGGSLSRERSQGSASRARFRSRELTPGPGRVPRPGATRARDRGRRA